MKYINPQKEALKSYNVNRIVFLERNLGEWKQARKETTGWVHFDKCDNMCKAIRKELDILYKIRDNK